MLQSPLLGTLLKSRSALIELFLAAVVLALGVNLLATALAEYVGTGAALWLLGISLAVLGVGSIARRTIASTRMRRKIKGLVCIQDKTQGVFEIPRYAFSENLVRYFKALFAENEAPRKLWDSDPISKTFKHDPEAGTFEVRATAAGQLITEATEYFVLETLSAHLTDFFNRSGMDEALVQELNREDVPDVVFRNRFLDTFSRPMHERAAFVDTSLAKKPYAGKIVSSFSAGGPMYSEFDLKLPFGAKVRRLSPKSVEIDTPKFRLVIEVVFGAFASSLPRGFANLYLDEASFQDIRTYEIAVITDVEFKPLALLSRTGWDYHAWLDSLLDELEARISSSAFFEKIDWNAAATVGRVVQRTIAQSAEKPPRRH